VICEHNEMQSIYRYATKPEDNLHGPNYKV
jgi:hypothetical protein